MNDWRLLEWVARPEAQSLWWGLCAGLTAVAAALTIHFFQLARRPIARA